MLVNNNHTVNFRGIFANNATLKNSIEAASDYDLYKFSKLLNRMAKEKDDRYFELSLNSAYDGCNNIVHFIKCKPASTKIYKVGFGPEKENNEQRICYRNVIKMVNDLLEKVYPEPKITSIPRETSIRRILNIVL